MNKHSMRTHCTFAGNTASQGGGVNNENFIGTPQITHTIFWGNGPDQMTDDATSPALVSYCTVQGGWPGDNMDEDPAFVDAAGGDYRLLGGSACIDAGDPDWQVPADQTDLDGYARLSDGNADGVSVVDIGAYETSCPYDLDRDGGVGYGDLNVLIGSRPI